MKQTLRRMIEDLKEKILEVKKVKVCIGKDKKPIPKDDEIIFHIDF